MPKFMRFSKAFANPATRGSACRTTISAAANQPLSTLERKGWIVLPSAGHTVTTSPVASSYQL